MLPCFISAVYLLTFWANQKVRSGDASQKENLLALNCTIALMLQEKSEA